MTKVIPAILILANLTAAFAGQAAVREPLKVRVDSTGSCLILSSVTAEREYARAIVLLKELHPDAATATFAPNDLNSAKKVLLKQRPRYVILVLRPDELDVNFAWGWLTLCTELNDDPLVDVRTGIITGASARDAAAFVERISAAVNGKNTLPARFVDNMGPNMQAGKKDFLQQAGSFMIPGLGGRLDLSVISHGSEAFTEKHLDSMNGAGWVHFGGHGSPERIDDGLRGTLVASLKLAPSVVFNGACYTGVTYRWYDQFNAGGKVAEKTVAAADCFCLNTLRTDAIAYLAALHPDHGMPVYQEMEFLAYSGAPLGDVIKHTQDGVIIASGGRLPKFDRLAAGMDPPAWSPSETMLKGTASRVLFGDPSVIAGEAFATPPFKVAVKADGDSLSVLATLTNAALKSSFTDTYWNDLSGDKAPFNDRALIVADLPADWKKVGRVDVIEVKAGGQALKSKLVGYAVEEADAARHTAGRVHVQVDVPATGFMQSALRVAGATVELKLSR